MIMDELITDRTQADVDRVIHLASIGWAGMTTAEKAEWSASLKGAYNASDLNRVGTAVAFLQTYLNGLQGILDAYRSQYGVASDEIFNVTWGTLSLTVKTDWTQTDIPTVQQMTVYLQNVDDVSACVAITRHLPSGMDNLTVSGANEIERVLEAEYAAAKLFEAAKKELIENASASWFYSGDPYSGEI